MWCNGNWYVGMYYVVPISRGIENGSKFRNWSQTTPRHFLNVVRKLLEFVTCQVISVTNFKQLSNNV